MFCNSRYKFNLERKCSLVNNPRNLLLGFFNSLLKNVHEIKQYLNFMVVESFKLAKFSV
ncbi:hypothetical protein CWI38_0062p0020 [Hamiltosporidium tvaerminnensis]|uniref:Uncharacterized protein n=1 Tax=Hamiltosporidium tvaerminnensis TaxID=1176355 RepID=A0A4Q9M4J3_9MICR|nr:hypothetical protein CWI38_0062p0020 [Hamiltosporidium tvaerminnensis]